MYLTGLQNAKQMHNYMYKNATWTMCIRKSNLVHIGICVWLFLCMRLRYCGVEWFQIAWRQNGVHMCCGKTLVTAVLNDDYILFILLIGAVL